PETVLQGRNTFVLIFEDDELARLVATIDHLPVLVVSHGRDAVGLLLQDRIDVEPLLDDLDAAGRAVALVAELRHPGQERILVATVPDPDGLALEVGWFLDAGIGAAGQLQTGFLEGLRDVDQWHAFFA